jgi:hypothetical protein
MVIPPILTGNNHSFGNYNTVLAQTQQFSRKKAQEKRELFQKDPFTKRRKLAIIFGL